MIIYVEIAPSYVFQPFPKKSYIHKHMLHKHSWQWGGGPRRASAHIFLGFLPPCSKHICLPYGSPITDFVFNPNSIFHLVSHLSVHLDQASHMKFVEFVPPFSRVVSLKFSPKPYKINFKVYLTTQMIQKRHTKNNLRRLQ